MRRIRPFNIIFRCFLCFFMFSVAGAGTDCKWCLQNDTVTGGELHSFLDLAPNKQIEKIETQAIKIFILNSGRKNNSRFFQWKKIEEYKKSL